MKTSIFHEIYANGGANVDYFTSIYKIPGSIADFYSHVGYFTAVAKKIKLDCSGQPTRAKLLSTNISVVSKILRTLLKH